MKELNVFIVALLCACAAVNVLFYALSSQHEYTKQIPEYFIQLHDNEYQHTRDPKDQTDDVRSETVVKFRVNQLSTRPLHGMANRKLHNVQTSDKTARDQRIFVFRINPYNACAINTSLGREFWEVVTIVISKIDNFIQRDAIRNTWGSTGKAINSTLLFLVGIYPSGALQKQLEKEAELYEDIIQVHIVEHYDNLSFKSIAMLQWLSDYCSNSKFYLKADDDVYANLENILHVLSTLKERRLFFCHVFKDAPPIRDTSSKWYVSKEAFGGRVFPMYCSGTAYVLDKAILHDLYRSSRRAKLLNMEDVFITGIAAEGLGISQVHDGGFSFNKRKPTGCAFEKALTGHEMTVKQMFIIFAQLRSKEVDCDTNVNKYLQKAEEDN